MPVLVPIALLDTERSALRFDRIQLPDAFERLLGNRMLVGTEQIEELAPRMRHAPARELTADEEVPLYRYETVGAAG